MSNPGAAPTAAKLAKAAVGRIGASPGDTALHRQILYDLKGEVVITCAEAWTGPSPLPKHLLDDLARNLPEFSTASLYSTRSRPTTLAGLVLAGFFLGGLASSLLSLVGLGGEIIRLATVWAVLQFADLVASRPGLRRWLLAIFGFGALAPLATRLLAGQFAAGLGRLGSGGLASMIFGNAVPGFLRRGWLLFGAGILFCLCRRKVTGLNLAAFGTELERQVGQRIALVQSFVDNLELQANQLATSQEKDKAENSATPCSRKDCSLALGLAGLLPGLPPGPASFLARRMAAMGFETCPTQAGLSGQTTKRVPDDTVSMTNPGPCNSQDEKTGHDDKDKSLPAAQDKMQSIVWNTAEHADIYETVGLVHDGDICHVLEPPCRIAGNMRKGYVQKAESQWT